MHIFLLLAIITLFTSLQGMKNNEVIKYKEQCCTVKEYLEYDKNNFFEMINNEQFDPKDELERIEKKFTYYRNKLNKEREASLLQLKNFHNISDTTWSEGMENLENIKTTIKNSMNVLPDAMHDIIVSGENKILLAKHLKKYGLDIKKICIEKKDINDKLGNELSSFVDMTKDENKKSIACPKQSKIIIATNQFHKMAPTHQKAMLLSWAWIMGNVCTVSTAFIAFIIENSDKNYTFDTLQNSKEYQLFSKIETQKMSEVFPCIEDCEACQYMENLRIAIPCADTTFDQNREHFREICTIKNLWEKRKILQELVQK